MVFSYPGAGSQNQLLVEEALPCTICTANIGCITNFWENWVDISFENLAKLSSKCWHTCAECHYPVFWCLWAPAGIYMYAFSQIIRYVMELLCKGRAHGKILAHARAIEGCCFDPDSRPYSVGSEKGEGLPPPFACACVLTETTFNIIPPSRLKLIHNCLSGVRAMR